MAELSTLGGVIKTAYEGQANTNAYTDSEKQTVGNLKPVATSGQYSDLSGTPDIPTNNNQLTNGSGYVNTDTTYAAGTGITISGGENTVAVDPGAAVADAAGDGTDTTAQLNALLASLRAAGIIAT